jgi:hypothetical protein
MQLACALICYHKLLIVGPQLSVCGWGCCGYA